MAYKAMKPGTVFFDRQGRRRIKTARGSELYWTSTQLYDLRHYFPNTENAEVADMLGVSPRTMIRKARSLGLVKNPEWLAEKNRLRMVLARARNRRGNSGQFRPGHNGGRQFKKGDLPKNAQAVIRLDTLEVYESGTALARVLGVSQTAVSRAIREHGRCKGVRVQKLSIYERVKERRASEQRPVWDKRIN